MATVARAQVRLECACGLVASGKTDQARPFFSPGGSFWANDSPTLLDLPANQDPRLHPRNKCVCQGYAAVARQIGGRLEIGPGPGAGFTVPFKPRV